MNMFRTNLVLKDYDTKIVQSLRFRGIELILKDEPTNCFWESKDGNSTITTSHNTSIDDFNYGVIHQKEVLFKCQNIKVAENIISLVKGGILLSHPDYFDLHNYVTIDEYHKEEDEFYTDEIIKQIYKSINNTGFGFIVANRVFNFKELCYAVEKYSLSLEINSCTPFSVDPSFGKLFDNYENEYHYHTSAAFAIISAYSVIEELGLEIRSSSKKPRFVDNVKGEWNPEVLDDIQVRLDNSNINNKVAFDWVYRGQPSEIEKELKPYFGYDSEWARYGEDVRDKTLTIPEAIHNASYLRNFYSSHKFNNLTQYINPYDVFNVQGLARELLLRKLVLWEDLEKYHNKQPLTTVE